MFDSVRYTPTPIPIFLYDLAAPAVVDLGHIKVWRRVDKPFIVSFSP